ncbi:uncharacterized protein [Eleutherodactylus coqui]|uniref:uncharacterized protein isoform X2 n=1 Tax=Eleutherodactylus coqui TaxID=57060 RepID=UPI003462068A
MAFLTLLVCSLLVASSYSVWWADLDPNIPAIPGIPGGINTGGSNGGGNSGGGNTGGSNGGGNSGGGYGGGNSGGSYGGGNSGGGSNNRKCSCTLDCVDVKVRGNTASCQSGYTATSCSCGNNCRSYSYRSSNTCNCQCGNRGWTNARCCKAV